MIDKKKLANIKKDILGKFPEFKGIMPKISQRIVSIQDQKQVYKKLAIGMSGQKKRIISMRFSKVMRAADSVRIERYLIVTMDENGEIIKITHSR